MNAEVDRMLTAHSGRRSANNGRATTLVGAASIAASLASSSPGFWTPFAIVALLVGAALGVWALVPRSDESLSLDGLTKRLFVTSREDIERDLFIAKLHELRLDEKSLKRMARRVRLGFVSTGVAVVFLGMHVAHITFGLNLPGVP